MTFSYYIYISRRLTLHLQNGAIKIHCEEKHGRKPTRKEIVEMTKARYYENDTQRLQTLEAIIIRFEEPVINRQDTGKKKILKLYGENCAGKVYTASYMATVFVYLCKRYLYC